jgi:alpha-mannosidase
MNEPHAPVPVDDHERQPLYYTFGNHMHWVDMEWLWGYHVLPGSVRDMLALCREAGVKGNINFDAVGYEKMAAQAPEALAELRQAIADGTIEVVGGSYAQPYGLFQGGESNVRQRVYGARAIRRVLGVWPQTFWEEEFDFFPQLPQILSGAGFRYASLFFQWTWHTPEVPREEIPAVWWESPSGHRLLTSTRNALNLHQWPEDFAGILDGPAPREMPAAGIVQWLELMPSPDWMCRSELILPQLRTLMDDPRFAIRPVTMSEYLDVAEPHAAPRRYRMDDVFHGLSIGKNADLFRQLSASAEHHVLTAEALSTLAGFFGRPYPSWDLYPTWEIDEAWREAMIGQHHDNDECEGLMGHIGANAYRKSIELSQHITARTLDRITGAFTGTPQAFLAYNPLGWERDIVFRTPDGHPEPIVVPKVPPFGYRIVADRQIEPVSLHTVARQGTAVTISREDLGFTIDEETGLITQIHHPDFPDGALPDGFDLGQLSCKVGGKTHAFTLEEISIDELDETGDAVVLTLVGPDDTFADVIVRLAPEVGAIDIEIEIEGMPRLDPGFDGALSWTLAANVEPVRLIHDYPYGVEEIEATGSYVRKYPTGDWMTSPQFFEDVEHPFTALQFLDFDGGDRGLMYITGHNQSFQRQGNRVRHILNLYDPWDEDYFVDSIHSSIRIVPHGRISNARRWKLAQEHMRWGILGVANDGKRSIPSRFGPVWCDAPNVAMTALFRETAYAGEHLDDYAGSGIEHPVVVRLVELDGHGGKVTLTIAGEVETARLATVRGDRILDLQTRPGKAPSNMPDAIAWTDIRLDMRPYEIATVYLDPVMARKQVRNLDEHRSVWATIHRTGH